MKKLTIIAFAILMSFGASSCKKACSCTYGADVDPAIISIVDATAAIVGDDKALCDELDDAGGDDLDDDINCSLK
jgi:ABC-type proline/glycine betaine transport system substrate-binding protein